MIVSFKRLVAATVIIFAAVPGVAQAESFSKLMAQGYTTGKLTKGKAGLLGWVVSKGGTRYFCQIKVATAYVSKTKMVSLTSSGRQITLDRATFEAAIGGYDPSIPQWSDLKQGRVKPAHVGNCSLHP